jgi:5'(3')-deoxyribonucleotidase
MKRYRPLLKELNDELFNKGNEYQIFCDLDGTLADFDRMFMLVSDMSGDAYEKQYGKNSIWDEVNAVDHFFFKLPLMPGADKLIRILNQYDTTVLTAPTNYVPQCKADKQAWVRKYLGGGIRVVFEKEKYKYATPHSILIDDYKKNIDPWIRAGGIGILHTGTNNTIKELAKYGVV